MFHCMGHACQIPGALWFFGSVLLSPRPCRVGERGTQVAGEEAGEWWLVVTQGLASLRSINAARRIEGTASNKTMARHSTIMFVE